MKKINITRQVDGDGIVDGKFGKYTKWSKWGECSASCGKGLKTRIRSRACNNPQPQYGGQPCKGDDVDTGQEAEHSPHLLHFVYLPNFPSTIP
jgi:hypothetical protein